MKDSYLFCMIPWREMDGMVLMNGCVSSVERRSNCKRESLTTITPSCSCSVSALILPAVGAITVTFGFQLLLRQLISSNSIFFDWIINSSLSLQMFLIVLLEKAMWNITSVSSSISSSVSFVPRCLGISWILEEH